jgi:pimeloyl-ACP methyl ester carboxylesterase
VTQVAVPGATLEVDDGGEGAPALLLVHALGGRLGFWKPVLREARREHRVVAFDLRGHGGSVASDDAWTLEAHAGDVIAVADAMRLDRFVLVGHSFGALVALQAAATLGPRVAGLVLVDAGGSFAGAPAESLEAFAAQFEGDGAAAAVRAAYEGVLERARPGTRSAVLASVGGTATAAYAPAYRAMFAADPAALLERYGGPVALIVDAENGSPLSLHVQQPSLARRELADVSHWMQLDDPDAFNAALDGLLTSMEAR